jgi:hypothetical protein
MTSQEINFITKIVTESATLQDFLQFGSKADEGMNSLLLDNDSVRDILHKFSFDAHSWEGLDSYCISINRSNSPHVAYAYTIRYWLGSYEFRDVSHYGDLLT